MEFNSGVMFIKDNNPIKNLLNEKGQPDKAEYIKSNIFMDNDDYVANPYFKMYAVGNMGNDKKNVDVFHDTSEGSVACCVEVTNNNSDQQQMLVPITMAEYEKEGDDLNYEFRYPDGNDKASEAQKQAWIDFVNWMAESNPSGCKPDNILKAVPADLTAETYVKNKFFI
jgi:hypothetical protein